VIVGCGAQVLGPFRVGDGARVAPQAVVLSEVPERVTMVGAPARPVRSRATEKPAVPVFEAYGIPSGDIPDPIARALNGLLDEVTRLRARVDDLEKGKRARPELQLGNGADDEECVA
jgi:serine O-acetyltransferase